jgi:hypothetical protein
MRTTGDTGSTPDLPAPSPHRMGRGIKGEVSDARAGVRWFPAPGADTMSLARGTPFAHRMGEGVRRTNEGSGSGSGRVCRRPGEGTQFEGQGQVVLRSRHRHHVPRSRERGTGKGTEGG